MAALAQDPMGDAAAADPAAAVGGEPLGDPAAAGAEDGEGDPSAGDAEPEMPDSMKETAALIKQIYTEK